MQTHVIEWGTVFRRRTPCPGQGSFHGSPKARLNLRGVPRDGRAMGAKHPARNLAKYLARHVHATSRQWPDSGSDNAAERPSRRLARQLALRRTWPRDVRAGIWRDNSQHGRATTAPQFAAMSAQSTRRNRRGGHTTYRDPSRKLTRRKSLVTALTMTHPNHESIHVAQSARSRNAAQGSAGISTSSPPCSFPQSGTAP